MFKAFLYFSILVTFLTYAQDNERFFYTNKVYGSEALFNPLTLMVNGGYDVTQLQLVSNRANELQYGIMFRNVMRNLGSPIKSIEHYGWGKFLKGEFLPLSFKKQEMQWIPNYQQHLIGSGMQYTMMREWYEEQNIPLAGWLSAVTLMTQHLFNEMIETGVDERWSVDEVSDIYIFDLGGILLFQSDAVNRFFARELNLSDWSLQASLTAPGWRVNAGQYFSIKWKLPFSDKYSLFYRYGMGALFGLSEKMENGDNLSYGIGFKSKHFMEVKSDVRQRTIATSWHAGVFIDRENSLLASFVMSGVKEYFIMADVYPGVLRAENFSPGIWTIIGRNGDVLIGFSSKWLIGFGLESQIR